MTASTWLLPRRKIVVDRGRNVVSDLKEGVVFIARTRIFAVLIGLSFANVFFVFGYIQVLPAFVDVFGGGDTKVGYLFSAAGIGALSGIVVAGRVHPGRYLGWLILGAAFFFSVLIFAVASSPSYSLALVLVALAHFGNGMFMIMTMTVLQLRVPDEMRGRVMGIYAMNQSLAVLGGLWAGSISGLFNPRVGVAAGPVVVIALIFVIALTQRAVRGLRDDVESRSTGRRFAR